VYIIRRVHCHTLTCVLLHTAARTAARTATHCRTAAHCRTVTHTRTAALPHTHCRTAANCRTAAHIPPHCCTLPHTTALPDSQPYTAARTATHYQAHRPPLSHTPLCTLPQNCCMHCRTLPHCCTPQHYRAAAQSIQYIQINSHVFK
jgi:hypothetical protein